MIILLLAVGHGAAFAWFVPHGFQPLWRCLGTATNLTRKVPNNFDKDGEQFIKTCCLYLKSAWSHQNHGEHFVEICCLYLKPAWSHQNHGEHFIETCLLYLNRSIPPMNRFSTHKKSCHFWKWSYMRKLRPHLEIYILTQKICGMMGCSNFTS